RRCKHLAPHDLFDFARHRNQKVVPLRARARLPLLVQIFFTVNPLAQRLKPFHRLSSSFWFLVPGSSLMGTVRQTKTRNQKPETYFQSVLTNCLLTQPLSGALAGVPPAQFKTRTRTQLPRSSKTRTRELPGNTASTAPNGSLRRLTFGAPPITASLPLMLLPLSNTPG